MSLLAKNLVKDRLWIVEKDGHKVASILGNENNKRVTWVTNKKRENYASLKILSDRYDVTFDKSSKKEPKPEINEVHGYPTAFKVHNPLYDIRHRLPVFTKTRKSRSFYCAGYYLVKFNNGWVKSYCPKFITLNRYEYQGPFVTEQEMKDQLRKQHGQSQPTS